MINCSVTVMPIFYNEEEGELQIGFLRRAPDDESYGGMLVAPGGKVEESDGEMISGVPYFSIEYAAIRELREETDIIVDDRHELLYFCSLTLPNGVVVISLYYWLQEAKGRNLEWLGRRGIRNCQDFVPGMREEALLLLDSI